MATKTNKEIVKWAGSQLHDLLGYSDSNLAEFIVTLGKKSKTPNDLLTKLVENDIQETPNSISFCKELYHQLNQVQTQAIRQDAHQSTSRTKTQIELLRKSESYGLVDMDVNIDVPKPNTTTSIVDDNNNNNNSKNDKDKEAKKEKKHSRKESKHEHTRDKKRHDDGNESEEDETQVRKRIKERNEGKQQSTHTTSKGNQPKSDTNGDSGETENPEEKAKLDEDVAARDEFVSRLLERDDKKTKKLEPQGLTVEQVKELATKGMVSTQKKD